MTKQEREEIIAAISQAFDDPYPPELAPPMVGRIAWRKQHVLEALQELLSFNVA